jgi:Ser-tRNA(Ala) deacylase AlaX
MTRKIFWHEPYRTRLDARIVGVAGDDVRLDQTIFYALSGGQESDHGTIGGRRVVAARKAGSEILYTLEPDHGLAVGDAVDIVIDWERRYRLMRLHFAAELVLELVYRRLEGVHKAGAHIAAEKARIDFDWDGSVAAALPAIGAAAEALIEADHEIVSAFSDEANERRYWEVAGFARVPCGGTHLRRTGEVGRIELKRRNPGKGKERIEIYLA